MSTARTALSLGATHNADLSFVIVALFLCCLVIPAEVAGFEDYVRIESKTVPPFEDSVRVAIFLGNQGVVWRLYVPLEVRSLTGGAFIRSSTYIQLNPLGRIARSQISQSCTPIDPIWIVRFAAPESTNTCSGPTSHTFAQWYGNEDDLFVSPDAHLFEAEADCGPLGANGDTQNADSASLHLSFAVNCSSGQFVIDTCCASGRHLSYYYEGGVSTPPFTPGVITIMPRCGCPCQADPVCDGITDVNDVVQVIYRAFQGASTLPYCPASPCIDGLTDVDCSGATDIVDVVREIEVAFRGGNASENFCSPCPSSQEE